MKFLRRGSGEVTVSLPSESTSLQGRSGSLSELQPLGPAGWGESPHSRGTGWTGPVQLLEVRPKDLAEEPVGRGQRSLGRGSHVTPVREKKPEWGE